jgi:sigma-B regulation protein RsbU (phosphoserine phosphatase)
MFVDALASHYGQFAILAQSWLAMGAASFSIWVEGEQVACWPPGSTAGQDGFGEGIQVGKAVVGEIRITGLDSPYARERLKAEAGLISTLIPMEMDLNSLATELINTRDQLVALYNLAQVTRDCLDVYRLMENLACKIAELMKAEDAFFLYQHPSQLPLIVHASRLVFNEMIWFEQLEKVQGEEYLVMQVEGAECDKDKTLYNLLLMPIPLRHGAGLLGMVNRPDKDFFARDIKLAKTIAEYSGVQIENVSMFHVNMEMARLQPELELARHVQLSLLPRQAPVVCGLDIGFLARPASHVGGDFYDFIDHPNQPFTFVVGDISGKGMPAALLMAMTRAVIRNEVGGDTRLSPERILSRSNTGLYDDFTELAMFATLFVGQYDPSSHKLTYASAGHSPVIFAPAGKNAHLLIADGTAIGILPKSFSRDQHLWLDPGDVLVVGSDGLSDARNQNNELFGYVRLLDLVESLTDKPARDIADGLLEKITGFAEGAPQEDDQTIVVIKYSGN